MEVNGFPPGVRFLPTPHECIHYLTCKVTSNPLPFHGLFLDLNPYSPKELPHIFSSVQRSGELYLFTRLHRKGKFGKSNANRKVGHGTWHGEQTFDITNDDDGTKIGMANKFIYREKGSQYDHLFRMTEYTLPKGTSLEYDPLNDYVLCHIVKNSRCHNGRKACKSKSTTNHRVAAVFRQPEPIATVAAANPISSAVENYPSTSSYLSSLGETPTNVQRFDTPSPALQDEQDNSCDFLTLLDYENETPSPDSSFEPEQLF